MLLDEESAKYLTIHMSDHINVIACHLEWLRPQLLSMHRAMDQILQGIPGVICYIDDILVIAAACEEHLQRLEEVLRWLK